MFCCTSDWDENASKEGRDGSPYSRYAGRVAQQLAGFREHYLCHQAGAAFSLSCISLGTLGGCDEVTNLSASIAHSEHHRYFPTFR